jgi:hypothetical protein
MIPQEVLNKISGVLDLFTLLLFALLFLLIGIGLTGAVLAARASWTALADQLDLILLSHSWRKRFLMGIINGPVLFIVTIILLKSFKLIGLALLFAALILIFLGLIAEMPLIGRRVLALRSSQCSLFAQTLAGGMVLIAIFMIPIAGQAVLLAILLKSLGTGIYWLFKRNRLQIRQAQPADTSPR